MFPEAGISFSYAVRSLMPGVASLARETGAPVVPVVQWGIHRIYSVGRKVDGREPGPRLDPRSPQRPAVRGADDGGRRATTSSPGPASSARP